MKAFDSIHQETLWKLMNFYCVPSEFVKLVRMFYTDVKCSILGEGGLTDWFEVKSVVKQGCVIVGVSITNCSGLDYDAGDKGHQHRTRMEYYNYGAARGR